MKLYAKQPPHELIRRRLIEAGKADLSYAEAGLSQGTPDACRAALSAAWFLNYGTLDLGHGRQTFDAACAALREWRMFDLDWIRLLGPDGPHPPLHKGSEVAVVACALGFVWSANITRVLDIIEEQNAEEHHFGFIYGTVAGHAMKGEERFSIKWNRNDDRVVYEVFSFSQPHDWLARVTRLYVRSLQRRFAVESGFALKRALVLN